MEPAGQSRHGDSDQPVARQKHDVKTELVLRSVLLSQRLRAARLERASLPWRWRVHLEWRCRLVVRALLASAVDPDRRRNIGAQSGLRKRRSCHLPRPARQPSHADELQLRPRQLQSGRRLRRPLLESRRPHLEQVLPRSVRAGDTDARRQHRKPWLRRTAADSAAGGRVAAAGALRRHRLHAHLVHVCAEVLRRREPQGRKMRVYGRRSCED